jgi:hypothetical protein
MITLITRMNVILMGLLQHHFTSPVSPFDIYDDDACCLSDWIKIIPFSPETLPEMLANLEASAAAPLPKVTDIPKLLKHHNIAMSKNDEPWYGHLNDFAMMLGIKICPPNAMDVYSEMGKEWDSKVSTLGIL